MKLEVEWCQQRQKCLDCGEEFVVKEFDLQCPACGTDRTNCIGGTELDVAYLEIEEELCAKS